MTALTQYERLESTGLWRPSSEAQRVDVIVSLGEATLTLTDLRDKALTHWSLAALRRLNPGSRPAHYSPDPESGEELELDDAAMIEAIEMVRRAVARQKPHRGRLRQILTGGLVAAVAALALFWLPGALVRYTATVVPAPVRAAVGQRLLVRIQRVSGQRCSDPFANGALGRLSERVLGPGKAELAVVPGGIAGAAHLPGRIILINRKVIEEYPDPAVVAGFLLVESERARTLDPMQRLLHQAGLLATFRLLTTGVLPEAALDAHAEWLATASPEPVDQDKLIASFAKAGIPATPYAYALDPSGETVLALIEADHGVDARPVLNDGDWVSLQGICSR
jgi:hypothetical protein